MPEPLLTRLQRRPTGPVAVTSGLTACSLLLLALTLTGEPDPPFGEGRPAQEALAVPADPGTTPDSPTPSRSGSADPTARENAAAAQVVEKEKEPSHPTASASPSGSPDGTPGSTPGSGKGGNSTGGNGKGGGSTPAPAAGRSLQSVNYPDRFVLHRNGGVHLDRVGGGSHPEAVRRATFTLVPGLADSNCQSFRTHDGGYLRHLNFQVRVGRSDGSALFHKDATFCRRDGAVSGSVSFESYNYPGRFLRHRQFVLRLDPYEHNALYKADTSFRLTAPPG
ncbi:AbfB domain-containing protein [Streptomyces sp. 549]|uniref:AbfB domain-containing protein n=1 Tax=Streptomyces sp. 549 TaxID=3049076 RepID=UPI0024C32437|nr:AbfB domain-containing protein [Streptomyces sp. 549]MDK1475443.1 AbfB domain-containing protein [Streptomyces sp. 549]